MYGKETQPPSEHRTSKETHFVIHDGQFSCLISIWTLLAHLGVDFTA